MRTHLRFLLLLALFVAAVRIHTTNLPVMEGSDEALHYNYAEYLRRENALPNRLERRANGIGQSSGQPPLAYWLMGLALHLLERPSLDPPETLRHLAGVKNRWHWPRDLWQQQDNKNIFHHGPGEMLLKHPLLVENSRIVRWVALAMGVIAVAGAYGAAREVYRDSRQALTTTALFAFTPTMIHASSSITNDTAAVAFSTLAIWQSLGVLRHGASPRRAFIIGALVGLAGLSKINSLLIVPGIGLALLFGCWHNGLAWNQLLRCGLLAALPFALIFGPWALHGALTYGDPLGVATHQHEGPGFYSPTPRSVAETLADMPDIYRSYWGKFLHVRLEPSSYHALSAVLILAAAGYAVNRFGRRKAWQTLSIRQGVVLAVIALALLAGLFRWMQQLQVVGARLIYPGHITIAIGITGGLNLLARGKSWAGLYLRAYSVGMVMAVALLLSPLTLRRAYGPPVLLQQGQLPALQGQLIDYEGIIRFLGYAQPSRRIDGEVHRITLCWEVLQSTSRPAAFSIKFARSSPIIADRTSIHGLGSYPSVLWQPGDRFCDEVGIRIDDPDHDADEPPAPAYVYDLLLVLLDAETLAVDWQATTLNGTPLDFPIIGQVVSPAGDMSASFPTDSAPSSIIFPGFAALHSYAIEGDPAPGEQIELSLLWDVTGRTAESWRQFIHLIGPDTALVLADGVPLAGDYPTWAWSSSERIVDTWLLTIPDTLPAGDYAILIGFSHPTSGERLPAVQAAGPAPDNAPVLLPVTIR